MKLKSIILALMCMVAPLCALAADNDNTKVTRTLRARAFNEISVNSGIKVIYTTGKLADFKAEGSRQMLDDLICRIEDGELELRLKRNQQRIMRTGDIVVHITAPAVKDIELNGGSVLVAKNAWSVSPDLDIEVNGGAVFTAMSTVSASEKVSFEVNGGATANVATGVKAPEVDVEVNGGAVANISSIQANDIDIESNGGAVAKISGAIASQVKVDVNGGATATVSGIKAKYLEVDDNGGAGATVSGHAVKASLSANAASRINARELTTDQAPDTSSHVASSISLRR